MPEPIRLDELQAELARLSSFQAEGFSTQDIADVFGWQQAYARIRLREWVRQGAVCFAGRRDTFAIDGRKATCPVYNVVKRKGKK